LRVLVPAYLLAGCGAVTRLELPPLPEQDYVRANVPDFGSKRKPYGSFGFRAFSDSLIDARYVDSTLTFGLVIPRSSLELTAVERKMRYGNDSLQCVVHYAQLKIERATDHSSLLGVILFPRREPDYNEQRTKYTTLRRLLTGILYDSLSCDTIRFYFEQTGTDFNLDSNSITGYFCCGTDSFFQQPSFKVIDIKGKQAKDMFLLQGYALKQPGTLPAFLLHAPAYRSGSDVLFLRRSLTPRQQLHFTAFLSLVSRVAHADEETHLF
jgi:hypothetical protein